MMKSKKILTALFLAALLISALCVPALALTESEVEAQVAASSKTEVAGNVLIWFLCAVAFLKVSQKIDSFMATLGVNVGRTGGSLLAEAMVAMRAVTTVIGGKGGGRAGLASGGAAAKSGASGMAGFFKGGLIGMAGRHVTNSAVKAATTQTSAVHTARSSVRQSAAAAAASVSETPHGPGSSVRNDIHTGGVAIHAGSGAAVGMPPQEGVIVTEVDGAPSAAQSGTIRSDTDLGSGAAPAIPQADAPIPGTPGPGEAAPIVSQAENVAVSESIASNDGGSVLIVPQGDSAAPIGPGNAPSQDGTIVTSSERHSKTQSAANTRTATNTQAITNTQAARKSSTVERSHTAAKLTHYSRAAAPAPFSLGGAIFSKSLASGGSFANDVIGTVARGEVAGSITGDMAAQSLSSYMGYTAIQETARDVPRYSNVEIGQGRITGIETAAGSSEGMPFAMYHVGQYMAPQGEFQKVFTADGTQWYKQYAQDAVERKPYMAPDDTVAYHEKIVKKMPDPPKRKDRK